MRERQDRRDANTMGHLKGSWTDRRHIKGPALRFLRVNAMCCVYFGLFPLYVLAHPKNLKILNNFNNLEKFS
jgi:hypothetical protein